MKTFSRQAQDTLIQLSRSYPAVVVTGPRQSGKTTLVRHIFPDKPYITLEDLDTREFATTDPRGFLSTYPDGAVLDEVQRCPGLFSYLQTRLDANPQRMGQFILTGSQQFGLLSGISQSLAGRVAKLSLLPFTLSECISGGIMPQNLDDFLLRGLYPPVHDRNLDASIFYANYTETYIERDVRQLIQIQNLSTFSRFIRLCAARTGQILNLSALAQEAGIAHNTARAWITVLEASYIVHLLMPHHANFNKRLVKSPKLYFYDTGLAAWLQQIESSEQLSLHPARGALFETWVVSEWIKARFNAGRTSNLFFWRDHTGHEVDLIVDRGTETIPVEIKSGQTLVPDFFKGIKNYRKFSNTPNQQAVLIYGGTTSQTRPHDAVVAWKDIDTILSMNS